MDVYKVKIYPTAKQDLREIIDYLNTLSEQAALRYYDLLIEKIHLITSAKHIKRGVVFHYIV